VLAASSIWLSVVVLLLVRALRQNRHFHRLAATRPPEPPPFVSVVVPARDEAANIEACVSGLLRQDYPRPRYEIIIVDDASADATAAIASSLLHGRPEARLIALEGLPRQWHGKPFACWTGACAARAAGDWLCFLDADVRAGEAALSSAVAEATRRRLDVLSLVPRQLLASFAERLVMPCAFYALAFSQDVRSCEPERDGVSACGPFMLVRRSCYFAAGGHRAVRNQICEDLALAHRAKLNHARVATVGGDAVACCRMYRGMAPLWHGLSKNAAETAGGTAAALALAAAAITLAWTAVLLPGFALCQMWTSPSPVAALAAGVAASATASAVAFHMAGARHFSLPIWYGALFPLGYTVVAGIALSSVRLRLWGHVQWRGRTLSTQARPRAP
jgi:chlorobactene glucosyltransferase